MALSSAARAAAPEVVERLFASPLKGQSTALSLVTLPVSLYWVLGESSAWQGTWGKRRVGLRVVRADGARLSLRRAIGRAAAKFVPWEPAHACIWQVSAAPQEPSPLITAGLVLVWPRVGANVASPLASRTRQTLHDRPAGTLVITR